MEPGEINTPKLRQKEVSWYTVNPQLRNPRAINYKTNWTGLLP